jgi:hypothetical protein
MTPERANLVRRSLVMQGTSVIASQRVAESATRACERLSQSLARFVGEHGVNTLFKRSALLAKRQVPWLARSNPWARDLRDPRNSPWLWLRSSMEQQDPESATNGFVLVLAAVVLLLENLVGQAVAANILDEAWPAAFPPWDGTDDQPN